MAVSKGGQSGKQSGSSTGNTSYNNTGETSSEQTGSTQVDQTQNSAEHSTNTTSGQTSGQTSGGFQTGVVAPEGYTEAWRASQPTDLGTGASSYFQNQTTRGSHTLGNLAARAASGDPAYASYAAPKDVAADKVQAGTGAAFMGNYVAPWNAVKDSALADYDVGAANTIGAFRGANAPFAANTRRFLSENDLTSRIAAGRGALSGQLLGQGYTTAANLGQADANRAAGVDTGNADRSLNAGQFNNTLLNNRQQADVASAYQGDSMRDSAAMNWLNADNTRNAANTDWLRSGQALFGQQGTNYGQQAGTTSGLSDTAGTATNTLSSLTNSLMNAKGTSKESGTGSSSGTTTGNSSGKSGGVSLG